MLSSLDFMVGLDADVSPVDFQYPGSNSRLYVQHKDDHQACITRPCSVQIKQGYTVSDF